MHKSLLPKGRKFVSEEVKGFLGQEDFNIVFKSMNFQRCRRIGTIFWKNGKFPQEDWKVVSRKWKFSLGR